MYAPGSRSLAARTAKPVVDLAPFTARIMELAEIKRIPTREATQELLSVATRAMDAHITFARAARTARAQAKQTAKGFGQISSGFAAGLKTIFSRA